MDGWAEALSLLEASRLLPSVPHLLPFLRPVNHHLLHPARPVSDVYGDVFGFANQ